MDELSPWVLVWLAPEIDVELMRELAEMLPELVGRFGCCSPRHRVLFNLRDEGSKCVG